MPPEEHKRLVLRMAEIASEMTLDELWTHIRKAYDQPHDSDIGLTMPVVLHELCHRFGFHADLVEGRYGVEGNDAP